MKEQELRDRIKAIYEDVTKLPFGYGNVDHFVSRIVGLIEQEEAKTLRGIFKKINKVEDSHNDKILAIIKEAGYVRLADDQSLPIPVIMGREIYKQAQQDMLNDKYRKVEL